LTEPILAQCKKKRRSNMSILQGFSTQQWAKGGLLCPIKMAQVGWKVL
jgi:hypothetical protein